MNLLLVATREYLVLNAVQCLHSSDTKIYFLLTENVSSVKVSRHCRGYIRCKMTELVKPNQKLIGRIKRYCKENNIEMLVPVGLEASIFLSHLSYKVKSLGIFPIAPVSTLRQLHNKWKFADFLRKLKLPYPQTNLIEKLGDLNKIKINFPAMIKPLELDSGCGMVIVNSINEIYRYLLTKNTFNKLPLIIQEYVEGSGLDVSFISVSGKILAWSIQRTSPCGGISFINAPELLSIVKKIALASSYTGIAHIDTICEKGTNKVKILEFNPRIWGTILGSKFAGVDFLRLGTLISINHSAKLKYDYKTTSYITTRGFLQNFLKNNTGNERDFKKLKNSDLWEMLTDPLPYIFCFMHEVSNFVKKAF